LSKLQDNAWGASVSPDQSHIAFRRTSGDEIWLMNAAGEGARRLVAAQPGDLFEEPLAWSPDSKKIAYIRRSGKEGQGAIETHELDTGRTRVVVSASGVRGLSWARDGHIVYGMLEGQAAETSSNLWQIESDGPNGYTRARPRRLTNWAGFLFDHVTISSDGRRIAFTRGRSNSDVMLLTLNNRAPVTPPQRLTVDERIDWPGSWTPDSRAVLFYSDRNGNLDIFRQEPGAKHASSIVTGPEEAIDPRVSPDGRWLLYLAWPRPEGRLRLSGGRLMRVPVSGGPPEEILQVPGHPGQRRVAGDHRSAPAARGHPRFRCPSVQHASCVLSEFLENQVVFTAFDVIRGRQRELLRIDVDPVSSTFWDLSPDGRTIAFGKRDEEHGRIRILSLAGEQLREVVVHGWTHLESVAWAPDQQSLFVTGWGSTAAPLLRVSLDGTAQLIYRGTRYFLENPVPSPDGRYIAFGEVTVDRNAWIVERFR
jgi:Tol biopolymer transport system component